MSQLRNNYQVVPTLLQVAMQLHKLQDYEAVYATTIDKFQLLLDYSTVPEFNSNGMPALEDLIFAVLIVAAATGEKL